MTSQGRHRPQPRATKTSCKPKPIDARLYWACVLAEAKGYEVRQVRVVWRDHGAKATVVLHLAPPPGKGLASGGYTGQGVGKTARRNIENLVAYVEGLPDVRHHDSVPGDNPGE